MKRLLVVLAACSNPPEHKLPSASITPTMQGRPPSAVCASDLTFPDGSSIRYRYTYDDFGRLARANGPNDLIEYEWDNLDHMVHWKQSRGAEVFVRYDTLGDMVEYRKQRPADWERYTYAGFNEVGQPARETIAQPGYEVAFRLEYDLGGRIARVVPEDEARAPTIYTYDDAAHTITIDTGNGASRGTIVYDEANHQLRETWDGTQLIASEQLYVWSGDRLQTVTYRGGTNDAPHVLQTYQVETYRYDCR